MTRAKSASAGAAGAKQDAKTFGLAEAPATEEEVLSELASTGTVAAARF
jgi:hypothetical protein